MPMHPSHQSWAAIHSRVAVPSSTSWEWGTQAPVLSPLPRTSWITRAYPRQTYRSQLSAPSSRL